jgi:dTDP-4-dehydrorhamnose 3,5-epimerase
MPITLTPLSIEGPSLIQPAVLGDERGYFLETYSERDLARAGIAARFVQDNQSKSTRGVLRGLHFQRARPQGKLVRVVAGEVFDVVVDLRSSSPTFGRWEGVRLSGELQNQLYIPPGFAHGFLVLSESAISAYKCTDFYSSEDEGGIRWDDPRIGIAWPDIGAAPRLSAKDRLLPAFDPGKRYF